MEYGDYKAKNQMELGRNEQTTYEYKEADRAEPRIYGDVSPRRTDIHLANAIKVLPRISRTPRTQPAAGDTRSTDHLRAKPLIVSSKAFIESFIPPDYLIDGLAQRRFLYSLTGNTGAGKTAIALRLAAHVALGLPIGDYTVEKGQVLYFAGENPDDLRMRWIALSEKMEFDRDTIGVNFVVGADKEISKIIDQIESEVSSLGGVSLIIVDTSAAYFNCEECDDENDNVQAGKHARMFRSLTTLSGGPAVLVLAHPPKSAKHGETLLPRGGGAFIAEVDGNFTVQKQDVVSELHWQGKFRGPEFEPISFELHSVTAVKLKDSRGRSIRTVLAAPLSEEDRAALEASQDQDRNSILALMGSAPGLSLNDMAKALGWKNARAMPDKRRTQKGVDRLKRSKLVAVDTDTKRFKLTEKGERAAAAFTSEDVRSVASTVPASQ